MGVVILLISYAILVVSACKPADRSQSESEGKFANQVRKSIDALTKTQKLAKTRVVKDAVKKAVDDGELDDLKKLIIKGDNLADAASLAYYRGFKNKQEEFADTVNNYYKRFKLEERYGEPSRTREIVNDMKLLVTELSEVIRRFASSLETRALQMDELVKATKTSKPINDVDNDRFNVALGLCCRQASLPEVTVGKSKKTLSSMFQNEHHSINLAINKIERIKDSFIKLPEKHAASADDILTLNAYPFMKEFRLAYTDMDLARTGLLTNLKDYEKIVLDAVKNN